MNNAFLLLWTVLIIASVFWYGFLVFYVGIKAGKEIGQLVRSLENRPRQEPPSNG